MAKKILKIDSQILDSFSKCERDFEHKFVHNLRALESKYAIQRGSLCHDIIEQYYNEYKSSRNKLNARIKSLELGRARINHYDAIDVPRGMSILENMGEYFTYYQNERWLPVETEKIHKKVIYEDDELILLYVCKIDVTVAGEPEIPLMAVDHKTYDRWFEPLATENQFTGYCTVLGINFLTVNKIGFQSSYPPEKKFRRVKLVYNDEKKQEWIHNTARIAKDMLFCLETNTFPMRRTQCGMYGGCGMLPICSVDPRARAGVIEKMYKVEAPWDPESPKEE